MINFWESTHSEFWLYSEQTLLQKFENKMQSTLAKIA